MEASLYIHVPFCSPSKCDYCDFYSIPVKSGDTRPGAFVETVLRGGEQLFEAFKPERIPTVFIGGGTPSVLGSGGIRALLGGIGQLIASFASTPEEVTVEANPESADEAFLAAACEAGATRLSLGVQTFYGPSRQAVHRAGPCSGCSEPVPGETWLKRRLALAAAYFPGALSIDLISGLPFQDEKVLLDDIGAALACKPSHVSLYALTLEDGTPLARTIMTRNENSGAELLPGRDEADRLWICGRDALERAGYGQYEVSNFCLSGRESRHNIRYWRMQNWLALGPSASGTIINDETGTGMRYTIPPNLKVIPVMQGMIVEELDCLKLIKETFLMGFRYIKGPDGDLFRRRFRKGVEESIPGTLAKWRKRGLLQKGKTALAKEGLLFLDPFLLDAFEELL